MRLVGNVKEHSFIEALVYVANERGAQHVSFETEEKRKNTCPSNHYCYYLFFPINVSETK